MGLADDQALLARLATDDPSRAQFINDPRTLAEAFGIDPDRADQLAREVERFAVSLWHKRRGEVEDLLPLSRRALGEARFARLFLRFAKGFVPFGVKKHREDALAFAEFVMKSGPIEPSWTLDLLRYESAALAATNPERRFQVRTFRHDLADLARAALGESGPPRRRFTLGVWFRASRRGGLRQVLVTLPCRERSVGQVSTCRHSRSGAPTAG